MNGAAWLLALATLGVDYGWQVDKKGQLEYIIQIPPSQLQALSDQPGGVTSSLPPEVVRHVRRFRIVVGDNAVPKEPLPSFPADVPGVTPINMGASRVNPAGLDMPLNEATGADASGVTPLDDLGLPRGPLPGPAPELPGDPNAAGSDDLLLPLIPRAGDRASAVDPLAIGTPGAVIRRDTLSDWRPNVSSPEVADAFPSRRRERSPSEENVSELPVRTLPERSLGPSPVSAPSLSDPAKDRPYAPLAFAVCALCLSIGGNIYLGWVAWGYYMRYRESFESWRGWSSPTT
jgi:hypothetical protein